MQGGGSTERDGVGKGYSGEDEAAVKLKKLWGIMGNSMSAFQMASFLQRLLSEAFGPSHVRVSIPVRKGLQEGRSGVSCPGLGRAPGAVAVVPWGQGKGATR